jgi:hypothetical protein
MVRASTETHSEKDSKRFKMTHFDNLKCKLQSETVPAFLKKIIDYPHPNTEAGGLVIGPTHVVEPEVPWENLLDIREAVNAYEKELGL